METKLDKFGRVVIPKQIREDLGLEAEAVLSVEERERQIILKVVDARPQLKQVGGVLVYTGKPTANIEDAIRKHRD